MNAMFYDAYLFDQDISN
ncbi:hypothetical protein JIY74_30090 [Vibrio harveyi]|nr:hypothetical protein [Vibrio harveyi]